VLAPTALVPVRSGPTAKRRLAHVLSAAQREELVRGLLDHVTGVLMESGLRVVVLSPSPIDVEGAEIWTDEAPGLNAALAAAIERLRAPVFIVHSDLPLLQTDDVDRVLRNDADVVIARSYDGGTNGLLLRSLIRPAFGHQSAAAHATRARRDGLRTSVLDMPGFAVDVDDESGLSFCASVSAFPRTRP
jgi:2-phospho-L-lactate guanylyltransferase